MADKKYIFGYGSLVSRPSITQTLQRDPGELHSATLSGWIRDWTVVLDNTSTIRRFELLPDRTVPKHVVALNVRRPRAGEEPTNPNGVIFEVSRDDIRRMDERENHYERIEITDELSLNLEGNIYTYVGLNKYETLAEHKNDAILPLSYLQLVEQGFGTISETEVETFNQTTLFPKIARKSTLHTSSL